MPVYSSRRSESPAAVMEPVAKVPTAMELWRRHAHKRRVQETPVPTGTLGGHNRRQGFPHTHTP